MTYEQLLMPGLQNTESTQKKLQSSRQASRASHIALPEKVRAIVTAVTCGEKLRECSEKLDRIGSSVKIRPVYLQGKINDSSEEFSMTLPRWGIASGGEYGELVTLERHTREKECFLWLTPTAGDGKRTTLSNQALAKHWMKKGGANKFGGANRLQSNVSNTASDIMGVFGSESETQSTRIMRNYNGNGTQRNASGEWWETEPFVGRVVNELPHRVDRLRCLGNAVVPAQAYPIFKAIADYYKGVLK